MYEKPKNWLSFRYNGFKRYVVDWRIADGRDGRTDFIGFEKRKNGKFVNRVKRYNGNLMEEVEYGQFKEDGVPGPALYSERVSEEQVPEVALNDSRPIEYANPQEFVINFTTNTIASDAVETEVFEWNP
jgi:hypothetical protein